MERLYADLWHLYLPDGEIRGFWVRGRATVTLAFGPHKCAATAHHAVHIRTFETIKQTQKPNGRWCDDLQEVPHT